MNKIQELEAKLQELQEEIASLKEKEEKAKPWPKVGDVYYLPNGQSASYTFMNDEMDKVLLVQGLMFRTIKEAESEFETRKVFEELRKQPGRVFEFSYGEDNSWTVSVSDCGVLTDSWSTHSNLMLGVYSSEQAAQDAIKAVGKKRIEKAINWFVNRKVW